MTDIKNDNPHCRACTPLSPAPTRALTVEDAVWAWRYYANPAQFASIAGLARCLGAPEYALRRLLQRVYDRQYKIMAIRRGAGGDLFARYQAEMRQSVKE